MSLWNEAGIPFNVIISVIYLAICVVGLIAFMLMRDGGDEE